MDERESTININETYKVENAKNIDVLGGEAEPVSMTDRNVIGGEPEPV